MVTRCLAIVTALALMTVPAQAAMPVASEEVAITTLLPNHAGEEEPTQTVEVYNPGTDTVDLEGWELRKFDPGHMFEGTCVLDLEGPLDPQGWETFNNTDTRSLCSWSANNGQLYLYDPEGALVSTVTWGEEGDDHEDAIPPGHALERCFLVNPDMQPAQDAHWETTPDPRFGQQNDPCLA